MLGGVTPVTIRVLVRVLALVLGGRPAHWLGPGGFSGRPQPPLTSSLRCPLIHLSTVTCPGLSSRKKGKGRTYGTPHAAHVRDAMPFMVGDAHDGRTCTCPQGAPLP